MYTMCMHACVYMHACVCVCVCVCVCMCVSVHVCVVCEEYNITFTFIIFEVLYIRFG